MTKNPNPKFVQEALSEFDGCECSDPGCPQDPYIWLFGIEIGALPASGKAIEVRNAGDDTYSVEQQLGYAYNQKAFKLLAVIKGEPTDSYREFARREQPFVKGSKGYFNGNLYTYACKNVEHWPADAEAEVGLTKDEYRQWCDENRIPVIHSWVNKYQPKLFIGVGLSAADLYTRAVFGDSRPLEETRITAANGQVKRLLSAKDGWRKLVVIPHLTGGPDGLNSDDSLQKVGSFIKAITS